MDGEAASENYAGIRYRDAEFAKLANTYIPVVVSVNRHNARDYDDSGKRIPCARFGRITCGEHIEIEPAVFSKYFSNNRVAPRHIGVGTDNKILFDCFLNFDVSPVVKALRENTNISAPAARANETPEKKLASRDATDRAFVENAYIHGDRARRHALLTAAADAKNSDPFDLLRLGLRDADETSRALACKALLARANANAVPLLIDALRISKDANEKQAFLQLLEKLSKDSARARWAATVRRALSATSKLIQLKEWAAQAKKAGPLPVAADADELESKLQKLTADLKVKKDAAVFIEITNTTLQLAADRIAHGKDPGYLLVDAKAAAAEAAKLDPQNAQMRLARARVAFYQNDWSAIEEDLRAALPKLVSSARDAAVYQGLTIFAKALNTKIASLVNANKEWSPELLTDAHSVYSAAQAHPLATAAVFAEHVDLLFWLDAADEGNVILQEGLALFPDAPALHERLRARVLEDGGVEALERTYADIIKKSPMSAPAHWFSAYASVIAAEYYKKAANDSASKDAYTRAILQFDKSIEMSESYRANSEHFIALALAGRARIEMEKGELEGAVKDLCTALERRPQIIDQEDGLGRTPMITMNALRWLLDEKQRSDLRDALETAIEKVDPDLASRPAKK